MNTATILKPATMNKIPLNGLYFELSNLGIYVVIKHPKQSVPWTPSQIHLYKYSGLQAKL